MRLKRVATSNRTRSRYVPTVRNGRAANAKAELTKVSHIAPDHRDAAQRIADLYPGDRDVSAAVTDKSPRAGECCHHLV